MSKKTPNQILCEAMRNTKQARSAITDKNEQNTIAKLEIRKLLSQQLQSNSVDNSKSDIDENNENNDVSEVSGIDETEIETDIETNDDVDADIDDDVETNDDIDAINTESVQSVVQTKPKIKLTLTSMRVVATWDYDTENSECTLCHRDLMTPVMITENDKPKYVNDVSISQCKHGFHTSCIYGWLKNKNTCCPKCKTTWKTDKNVNSSVYVYN